jgi:Tfp pilus assembly protein PilF
MTPTSQEVADRITKAKAGLESINAAGPGRIAEIGAAYLREGQFGQARDIFTFLVEQAPDWAGGYAGLGALELTQQQLPDAKAHFLKAIEKNPSDPAIWSNLGETLFRMGEFDPSSEAYSKAFALDPNHQDPTTERARAVLHGVGVVTAELRKMAASN